MHLLQPSLCPYPKRSNYLPYPFLGNPEWHLGTVFAALDLTLQGDPRVLATPMARNTHARQPPVFPICPNPLILLGEQRAALSLGFAVNSSSTASDGFSFIGAQATGNVARLGWEASGRFRLVSNNSDACPYRLVGDRLPSEADQRSASFLTQTGSQLSRPRERPQHLEKPWAAWNNLARFRKGAGTCGCSRKTAIARADVPPQAHLV